MATEHVSEYFSGQGKLWIAPVMGGVIQHNKSRWVGNVPELTLETEVETEVHKESWSGRRAKDLVLKKEKSLKFTAKLEEFTKENLALGFQATVDSVPAGAAADVESAADLEVGDVWFLPHRNVNTLAVTDSTATPVTLVAGEHYTVDEMFGRVQLLKKTGLKFPLKASYKYAAASRLDLLKTNAEGWYLRFEGLNTANGNAPVLVEVFKSDLSPTKTLNLITDELGSFDLEGEALLHNGKLAQVEML